MLIELRAETDASQYGDATLVQLGLDRSIDQKEVIWPLLAGQLFYFRFVALAVVWFFAWWERRKVRRLHDITDATA